jgi:uncharacterized protein (DUF2235 family)
MSKNILLFSDGTGNSAAKLAKTNVWRLYQAVDLSDSKRQIAYYDDGVGTSSFKPLALLGGAFGWGLKRNVLDLYTFLCRNYDPGDRIFCFGFSRGAFTARVLAGLIVYEGIVNPNGQKNLRKRATTAFREYRRKRYRSALRLEVVGRFIRDLLFRKNRAAYDAETHKRQRAPVTFLGIWDTVAAYGLPFDELTRALNFVWPTTPMDRDAHKDLLRVCHAVAIDDERNTFHPMLYNETKLPENEKSTNIAEERVTQVWFAGMHSNVGGGYPDDDLSYVPLDWMIRQAEARCLLLKPDAKDDIANRICRMGVLHDSRRGVGGFYRYLPRKMSFLTHDTFDKNKPCFITRPKIHESVFERIAGGVDGYAPIVLPERYAVVTGTGKIVDHYFEHETQAKSRCNAQEHVWNLVWRKRVAYFSSVLVAGALATFPFWRARTEACEGFACSVAPVIDAAGMVLPGFAEYWLSAYRSHPGTFLLLLVPFVLLLKQGDSLQNKLQDLMRSLWKPIVGHPNSTCAIAPLPTDAIYRLRASKPYRIFFLWMKRIILPILFGLTAVWLIAGVVSRSAFKVVSAAGFVCDERAAAATTFRTNSVCTATGTTLERGRRYRITISMIEPWRDNTIATGVGGFDAIKMGWAHPAFMFFRRTFGERWFTPIARIGEHGNDEYPLHPANGSVTDENTQEMVAEITARRAGPLFVFVNDAVLPVPQSWQGLYANNHGAGRITIEPLP